VKPNTTRSVLVIHALPTALEYVNQINRAYPVTAIVAVPYSSDIGTIERLKRQGYRVVLPADVPDTFRKARAMAAKALTEAGTPLMVQEVGGYLAEATKELASFPDFRGIVEDTNNGHWRYERFGPHPCPVLSIAQSPLKDIEDSIIGDAVVYSIERLLRDVFRAVVPGTRCAVIGYGKIGSSTALALRGRKAVVSIYDINPTKNIRAKVDGFFPAPLHPLLREAELIIGCTGQTSLRLPDLGSIKDGAILVSASSKDIEFDIKGFAGKARVVDVTGDKLVQRFDLDGGLHFYLLNQGTPINFRDKSVIGAILDLVYSELFVCIRQVAEGRAERGLHSAAADVQDEVAKAWLRVHSPTFAGSPDDKIWNYPASLELGRTRAGE
jgi:adenosylhomocysteinase